jgi:hypothetical protein
MFLAGSQVIGRAACANRQNCKKDWTCFEKADMMEDRRDRNDRSKSV